MDKFDYEGEMLKVRDFINREEYRIVGETCGLILEKSLKKLYSEIKKKAGKEILNKIESTEKDVKGKSNHDISFNQLITIFNKADIFILASDILNREITIPRSINFYRLKNIRNGCAHGDYTPNLKEIRFFYFSLKLMLEEIGYISETTKDNAQTEIYNQNFINDKIECKVCHKIIKMSYKYCPFCTYPTRNLCVKCNNEIDDSYESCPECRTKIKRYGSKETDFLKHVSCAMVLSESKGENCPICEAESIFSDVDIDEKTGKCFPIYNHTCNCRSELTKLQKNGSINEPSAYKFIQFYEKINKANLLDYYPAVTL